MEDGTGAQTAAGLSCGSCGTGLAPDSRFCNKCGAPVTQANRPAEFKQVTVLFADVVQSMDLAAAVGAERLREIMATLADRCATVVQRYGGTVDKFTGDGIMAVFGAPMALEDHGVRACLAALGVQEEAGRLAGEVHDRDGAKLHLRVGLNSGEVIAGEIGSGPFGYTAVGEQVGMAQRMESVAPPGGVMLSASTARLVEDAAALGEPETLHIKGFHEPMSARLLLGLREKHRSAGRAESTMVGRRWEMSAMASLLDRAVDGHGAVVSVVGPPGIGKSRLVREVTATAAASGVALFSTFCESHTSQIPFHAVARLLRAAFGIEGVDSPTARDRIRLQVPEGDPEDFTLLDDLLGIADQDVSLPHIDPDARRRRLTALVNAASLGSTTAAVYVIEDAHWIDEVSESMLADFLMVVPQTPFLVLITYRADYEGQLSRVTGAQTVALAPLSESETSALVSTLLGPQPNNGQLGRKIIERAAGNPFFAEEIVRDLAERGVLQGKPGLYTLAAEVSEVSVPATLQATISARIDRLDATAKKTINAAAVIGLRFTASLLTALGVDPDVGDLVRAELVDQVRFTPHAEYAFPQPLIRAVAYRSQLKSDRAQLHRALARAIEGKDPAAADENAALVAEHLEAAGDLEAAYVWHMRAGAWAANRDIAAAWLSWERARRVADALPGDHPSRLTMRIAPRTALCGSAWRRFHDDLGTRFEELRELCAHAGDKASLAMGMAGMVLENLHLGSVSEASRLASECMAIIESVEDPMLVVGLSFAACAAKIQAAEWHDTLRWSQQVMELAARQPDNANAMLGSPVAAALVFRGVARWRLGHAGWRDDIGRAVSMTRTSDPVSHAIAISYKYSAIHPAAFPGRDAAMTEIGTALEAAERSSDDIAVVLVRLSLGSNLSLQEAADERLCGLEVLAELRALCATKRFAMNIIPALDAAATQRMAADGDLDGAIVQLRSAADAAFHTGNLASAEWVSMRLVEALTASASEGDIAAADAAIDRLATTMAADDNTYSALLQTHLRALVMRARGNRPAFRELVEHYRATAPLFGLERSMAWADF